MIVGVAEVSEINDNGMMGRFLFVEGGGDGFSGVGWVTVRLLADRGRRMSGHLTDEGEGEML